MLCIDVVAQESNSPSSSFTSDSLSKQRLALRALSVALGSPDAARDPRAYALASPDVGAAVFTLHAFGVPLETIAASVDHDAFTEDLVLRIIAAAVGRDLKNILTYFRSSH